MIGNLNPDTGGNGAACTGPSHGLGRLTDCSNALSSFSDDCDLCFKLFIFLCVFHMSNFSFMNRFLFALMCSGFDQWFSGLILLGTIFYLDITNMPTVNFINFCKNGMSSWSVVQSCPTLCDPMDSSLPGSSVQGILQERVLEWVAISFSRGSSQNRDPTSSPTLQADSLPSESPENPKQLVCLGLNSYCTVYWLQGFVTWPLSALVFSCRIWEW